MGHSYSNNPLQPLFNYTPKLERSTSGGARREEEEQKEIMKCKDLHTEVEHLQQKKAKNVPILVGTLGSIPKDFEKHLNSTGVNEVPTCQLQSAAFLGRAHLS